MPTSLLRPTPRSGHASTNLRPPVAASVIAAIVAAPLALFAPAASAQQQNPEAISQKTEPSQVKRGQNPTGHVTGHTSGHDAGKGSPGGSMTGTSVTPTEQKSNATGGDASTPAQTPPKPAAGETTPPR